jgi:hypothetical protein
MVRLAASNFADLRLGTSRKSAPPHKVAPNLFRFKQIACLRKISLAAGVSRADRGSKKTRSNGPSLSQRKTQCTRGYAFGFGFVQQAH